MMTQTRGQERSTSTTTLRSIWAFVLILVFMALSLTLLVGGLVFAILGAWVALAGFGPSSTIRGVLFVGLGLVAVVGSGLNMQWLMPRAVTKLSGRKTTALSSGSGSFYGVGGGGFGGGNCGGGGDGGGC